MTGLGWRRGRAASLFALAACTALAAACASKYYRPTEEMRTASTGSYQLSVQKIGRFDVNLNSGAPIFRNAYAAVWIDGQPEPRVLAFDGRRGTRIEVNSPLGQGHGLLYKEKDVEVLIQTFPTQPFLTVQAAYYNSGKEPVRVRALMPWCVRSPGGVYLGAGADRTVIRENGGDVSELCGISRRVTDGRALSQWNLAAHNPESGRSLIAGFLTHHHGFTRIRMERSDMAPPEAFDRFAAECVYDPPLTVAPGGALKSELLYLGVTERDPLAGLERYGHAMAVTNGIRRERPPAPNGGAVSSAVAGEIDEGQLLEALDFFDRNLKRYGWTHFDIGDAWQRMPGDWEPDPVRFSRGLKWFVDRVHERGMTAGLRVEAFLVDRNAPVAADHPEWLRMPTDPARAGMAEDERILDITAPGAYEHVRERFARIGREWGFDAVSIGDSVNRLGQAESYHDAEMSRVEVMRRGLEAIREGLGRDRFLLTGPPGPVAGVYADGIRTGCETGRLWRTASDSGPWGAVDALTQAAGLYYFAPYMWSPDPGAVYLGGSVPPGSPRLTPSQSLAWLTGAALAGGVVRIGDVGTAIAPDSVALLQRLLPVPPAPARPIDLFENDRPRIWSLPMRGPAGEWQVVALFNWDESASQNVHVDFRRLGLPSDTFYTVYNYWGDTYHGTADNSIEVSVPPASVQVLGLRRFENRPMLLACTRHVTQGALDVESAQWNERTETLTGSVRTIENTAYGLRFLVPNPYGPARVTIDGETPARTETVGPLLKVDFPAAESKSVAWRVEFAGP